MWSLCGVYVESMWSPWESSQKRKFFVFHVESMWSPHGVQWSLCGVMESTWSLWGSVKYTNNIGGEFKRINTLCFWICLALVILEICRQSRNMVSQIPRTPDHISEREYTVEVKEIEYSHESKVPPAFCILTFGQRLTPA
jgi:hypothetical protein